MVRALLRLNFWLLLGSVALIGLLRFTSYDGAYFEALRSTLASDADCESPCYLNIQPGQTPAREATYRLEAHPWVAAIRVPDSFITLNAGEGIGHHSAPEINWTWNGQQPPFLAGTATMQTNPQRYVVNWLAMPSRISLAEIQAAFGLPLAASQNSYNQILVYADFHVRSPTQCRQFWDVPVEIIITGPDYNASPEQVPVLWQNACQRHRP